jgi:hypothetical protein
MIDETHLRQLIAAKHLYFLSEEQIRSERTVAHLAGVNLLHDSVEMALWAAASATDATRNERSELIQLFDSVNAKIGGGLPFRSHLVQFNRLRVNAKHYGMPPDIDELRRYQTQMLEIISELVTRAFDEDFASISLLSLLPSDRASTELLINANTEFKQGNFNLAVVEASKALFLEFFQKYDVRPWRSKETEPAGFSAWIYQAPYWAKNAKYIEEKVHDPIDFIVTDHADVDKTILQAGLDYNVFWNIWRLTPRVYRPLGDDNHPWAVRHDGTADEKAREHSEYVLHHLTEILLRVERERQKSRVRPRGSAGLVLAKQGVVLRQKAAADSASLGLIPQGIEKVNADYQVDSLDGSGKYWHVLDILDQPVHFLVGYIHESDVAAVEDEAVRFSGRVVAEEL